MTIPTIYRGIGESMLANYNWSDIAAGIGYSIFYGAAASGAASLDYMLVDSSSVYSDIIETQVACSGAITESGSIVKTVNFDTSSFNLPRVVKGKAFVNIPADMTASALSTIKFYATISKMVGAVEQFIASGATTSAIRNSVGAVRTHEGLFFVPIECPLINIKKDEKIRLKIEMLGWNNASSIMAIGHDPQGRFSTAVTSPTAVLQSALVPTTQLSVHIPFRIDL